MAQTSTVEMVYNGRSAKISCPVSSKYEDFVKIAMERFSIVSEFRDYVRLFAGHRYIFDKNTFENYLVRFPNPEMIFEIRVNYVAILDNLHLYAREPMNPTNMRVKRRTINESELSKRNLFSEYLSEHNGDQPIVKRMKMDYSRGPQKMEF